MRRLGTSLFLVAMFSICAPLSASAQRLGEDDYRQKFVEGQNLFYLESDQLASNLKQVGELSQAAEIIEKLDSLSVDNHRHIKIPSQVQPAISPVATPENAWKQRWRRMQNDHAGAMYSLAHQVLKQQMVGLGYRILRYTLMVNPDHAEARQMLGYMRYENEWMTPFELEKRKDGEIWDDRFGWIDQRDLTKYEQGLRPFRSRWIPEEQDRNLAAWLQKISGKSGPNIGLYGPIIHWKKESRLRRSWKIISSSSSANFLICLPLADR